MRGFGLIRFAVISPFIIFHFEIHATKEEWEWNKHSKYGLNNFIHAHALQYGVYGHVLWDRHPQRKRVSEYLLMLPWPMLLRIWLNQPQQDVKAHPFQEQIVLLSNHILGIYSITIFIPPPLSFSSQLGHEKANGPISDISLRHFSHFILLQPPSHPNTQ